MIALRSGERLLPEKRIQGEGLVLIYQSDGNLVVYQGSTPIWASNVSARPGYTEMQTDGNLVSYDFNGSAYWHTGTFDKPGALLEMRRDGLFITVASTVWEGKFNIAPQPEPPPGNVRKLVGLVKTFNKSFADDTGARIVHGCTDFGALIKHHEDRDKSLRSLDVTSAHQQYIRVAWRLNGTLWTESGLTVDPIRDSWWEEVLRSYLIECANRNLRVSLTCADMFNWSDSQAESAISRLGQIAASVSQTVVIDHEWNEARGTCPNGENDVDKLVRLSHIWESNYPWSLRGLSDPGSQDKEGMIKLSKSPANIALIHNVRQSAVDAIRRAYNLIYEGYPDKPVKEGEPTGPNGSVPAGQFTRKVFQPIEDHNDLLAIYTTHILTGQISTYFNDPALYSREPLDSTWGFKEIPALWKQLEIPENVGQGRLIPGHKSDAPLRLTPGPSNARADSVEIDGKSFGIMSGGAKAVSGRNGTLTAMNASGMILEQPIQSGQVIPYNNPAPVVIRIR